MNPALFDVLDWVEEMREDLRSNMVRGPAGLTVRSAAGVDFDWAACGTPTQYRRHLRLKIPPCHLCRAAEARRSQDRYRKSGLEVSFARQLHDINLKLNGATR